MHAGSTAMCFSPFTTLVPKRERFLAARRYANASADTSYGPVYVFLCLSHVGVLSKLVNELGWFYAPNSGLRKIRQSISGIGMISIVEACYQLSSTMQDAQSVINWTVVGQLS